MKFRFSRLPASAIRLFTFEISDLELEKLDREDSKWFTAFDYNILDAYQALFNLLSFITMQIKKEKK